MGPGQEDPCAERNPSAGLGVAGEGGVTAVAFGLAMVVHRALGLLCLICWGCVGTVGL